MTVSLSITDGQEMIINIKHKRVLTFLGLFTEKLFII